MKLIFVYNADSGRLNALFDIAHKVVRPDTYACSLCALTHDAFSQKSAWKQFRDSTELDMTFLHKDEFEKAFGRTYQYPVVLRQTDGLETAISAEEIGRLQSVDELIRAIKRLAD